MSARGRYRPWFRDGKREPKRPEPKPVAGDAYVSIYWDETVDRSDEWWERVAKAFTLSEQ